ncbi:MAG: RdgB/HAM1 family non-canonical purine NTP pyrophosphatase [Bacteroidaceae bacterium]|nr:RdgB/HAM1 family non-canonical purine NTP pyrophosphatase [Bacteroidaceae bacterium]
METLVLATNNAHKLEEIRAILGNRFDIKSQRDIGCHADIPETGSTFQENALQKAQYVKEHYGYDCFADDSGLEVEALHWEPGIYSARYAQINGREVTPENKDNVNMDVLLEKLEAQHPQCGEKAGARILSSARFRTAIALLYHGSVHYFDGIVPGVIIDEKRGTEGFGYDPIFVPDGYTQTFAQMGADIKNGISHRGRAVTKLAQFLTTD